MNPTIKANLDITIHRDGTVSLWNVMTQTWERWPAGAIPDDVLAALPEVQRQRIQRAMLQADHR